MLGERSTGAILIVNAILNGPWMVALSLAIALIITEYRPTFLGFGDLAAYALVMGAYGVGDVSGNITAASLRFKRPLSTMFLGYVVMGIGFSWLALSVWLLPSDKLLPAMMIGGLLAGLGGPFFFVPMITRMQTVFHGHDIARVLSLPAGGHGRRDDGGQHDRDLVLRADGRGGDAARLRAIDPGHRRGGHVICRRHENRDRAGAAESVPAPGE